MLDDKIRVPVDSSWLLRLFRDLVTGIFTGQPDATPQTLLPCLTARSKKQCGGQNAPRRLVGATIEAGLNSLRCSRGSELPNQRHPVLIVYARPPPSLLAWETDAGSACGTLICIMMVCHPNSSQRLVFILKFPRFASPPVYLYRTEEPGSNRSYISSALSCYPASKRLSTSCSPFFYQL